VDPTGYVKGWAAQQALAALAAEGITGAVVNAAGDIASSGTYLEGIPFRFGILDPTDTTRLAAVADGPRALATSGTYERGAHLIDPRTGVAQARVASASVTGPDLGRADALATAVAVAGVEGIRMVEDIPDYEAFVITRAGGRIATVSFPFVRA
jgi:thiamine biosynthesis lipoprotein